MIDFNGMGQPAERRLRTLPRWALEWIETLKYRVLYWHGRSEGRTDFAGRVNVEEPDAAAIFGLPFWAQDWIDLLRSEAIDLRARSRYREHCTEAE